MPYAKKKSEASFQWDVCHAAYHNGWRVTYEDFAISREYPNATFRSWAGKMFGKIAGFLFERRRGAFTFAYHTHDSRNSQKGFPDLVLVHPGEGRVIFAELKRIGGYPTLEQRLWLAALDCVAEQRAGVEVYLWDPRHWSQIVATLGGIDPKR